MLRQPGAAPCRASGASATGRILGPAPCGSARCLARTLPCGPVGHAAPGPPWWPYLPQRWPYLPQRWRGQPGPQQSDRQCMGLLHVAARSFEGGPWPLRGGTLRDAVLARARLRAGWRFACRGGAGPPRSAPAANNLATYCLLWAGWAPNQGMRRVMFAKVEQHPGGAGAAGPPATRLSHPTPLSQAPWLALRAPLARSLTGWGIFGAAVACNFLCTCACHVSFVYILCTSCRGKRSHPPNCYRGVERLNRASKDVHPPV